MAIQTRVASDDLVSATVTLLEMASERSGAADGNGTQDFQV
jgi:hypothetical protein